MLRDPEFQDNFDVVLGEIEKPKKRRPIFWKVASRVMEIIVYALLLVAAARLFVPEMDRQKELRAELEQMEKIRDGKEADVKQLREEHRLLKTDRGFLEARARDRLNKQREGEYIIRIEGDE